MADTSSAGRDATPEEREAILGGIGAIRALGYGCGETLCQGQSLPVHRATAESLALTRVQFPHPAC